MKTLFADTGYWIALLDPQDTLHQKAIHVSSALTQAQICTSDRVFTEVLNHFAHTDCASFCIMQQQSIREALAYDKHFEQTGFVVLLR